MVISDQFANKSMAAALQQARDVAGGAQIQVLAIFGRIEERNYAFIVCVTMMMQEEEEQFGPLLVATLEQHGIAAADVKKLMVCGIVIIRGKVIVHLGCGILHCGVGSLCAQEEVDGDQGKNRFKLALN